MPRSHPPTLIRLVERCLERECQISDHDLLLVAVSGGPDSMALLDVLGRLARKRGFALFACGVDHGLRPEANQELDLAALKAVKKWQFEPAKQGSQPVAVWVMLPVRFDLR